jgi:hypothetical protein
MKSLRKIDANEHQGRKYRLIFHGFRNGFDAHDAPDMMDGLHDRVIHCIGGHILDEFTVDLQIIDRQAPQVGE